MASIKPALLAVDVGTSSLKAVAYGQEPTILAANTQRYSYTTPQPGWAEADPDAWWTALRQACLALQAQGMDLREVEAVAFTGQMHTAVLLDTAGRIVPPTILWLDRRAARETSELAATLMLPPYQLNSTYTLPKLVWLARHCPETLARVRTILWPKDYLRYRLTGVVCTDPTEPGGAALLDWDTRAWAVERLALVGLDSSVLPPIRRSTDVIGEPLPEAARLLGINPEAQVMVGIGDVAALVGGAPPRPGRVVCSLGSSSMVFMALAEDQHPIDPEHRLYTYPLDPYRLLGGVSSTTGAALTWAYTQFASGAAKGASFAGVMAEAAALKPGADGLCFIPYLAGERSPYWQDDIRGGFYGFRLAHDHRHLVRAVMEGIAYSLRHLLDIYVQLGVPVRELVLAGGGTQTPGLCQIIADVCGLDAAIYCEEETVTRVLHALYRAGLYGADLAAALDHTFPEPGFVRCNPTRAGEIYARGYASYRRFADFALAESLQAAHS